MKASTDSVRVVALANPFKRDVLETYVPVGWTLAEIIGETADKNLAITINGEPVPQELWHFTRVQEEDFVAIVRLPGEGDNDILRLVAIIAVAAIAWYAGPYVAGLEGFAGSAILSSPAFWQGAIFLAGSLAVAALIPPPTLPENTDGTPDQLNAITGTGNKVALYQPVPNLYGKRKIFPPYAALPYTEIIGEDQYLNAIFCVGLGEYDISASDFYLGETLLTNYDGVEATLHGVSDVPQFPNVTENQLAVNMQQLATPGTAHTETTPVDTEQISLDFNFPGGLLHTSSKGDRVTAYVEFKVEYSPAGQGTWTNVTTEPWNVETYGSNLVLGSPGQTVPTILGPLQVSPDDNTVFRVGAKSIDPIRCGMKWSVTSGQYDVRVTRIRTWEARNNRLTQNVEEGDGNWYKYSAAMYWNVMRSFTPGNAVNVPAGVATFIKLRIRASDQLQGAIDDLNLIATRKLRSWNKVGQSWNAAAATRSPAWAWLDILTGGGNARPLSPEASYVWLDDVADWDTECTSKSWYYDEVLDYKTSVFEAIRRAASVGRAASSLRDGKWTVIIEQDSPTPAQYFTPRNSWGFSSAKNFYEQPHALKVTFDSEQADYQQDEIIVYDDGYNSGNATKFETLSLKGITDADMAWKFGRYHIAALRLRPETYTFSVDIEHLVAVRGDHIKVAHDIPLWGVVQGRIKSVSGDVITLDEKANLDGGTTYRMRIRKNDGTDCLIQLTTQGGNDIDTHTRSSTISGTYTNINVGDLVMVGEVGSEAVDLVITAIEPGADLSAKITALDAAPGILTADSGTIPTYNPNITLPVERTRVYPPIPYNVAIYSGDNLANLLGSGSVTARMAVGWSYSTTDLSKWPGVTVTLRYRVYDATYSAYGAWKYVRDLPVAQGYATLTDVQVGEVYQVQLKSVSSYDRESAYTALLTHTVQGRTVSPLAPPTPVATADYGTVNVTTTFPNDWDGINNAKAVEFGWSLTDSSGSISSKVQVPCANDPTDEVVEHTWNFSDTTTRYFFVRLVDVDGNVSSWSASDSAAALPSQAQTIRVSATALAFGYDTIGDPLGPTDITFTAFQNNLSGNASWQIFDEGDVELTPTSSYLTISGTNNEFAVLTQTTFTSINDSRVRVKVTWDGLTDEVTIHKLQDGAEGTSPIVGYLTDENITVPADNDGSNPILPTGAIGTFKVFEGTTPIAAANTTVRVWNGSQWALVHTISGLRITLDDADDTYDLDENTAWNSTDTVVFQMRASYGGVDIDKDFTVSKALAGADSTVPGVSPISLQLLASSQIFKYTAAGTPIEPDEITFQAFIKNDPGGPHTVNFRTQFWTGTQWADTSTNRMTPTSDSTPDGNGAYDSSLTDVNFAATQQDQLRVVAEVTISTVTYTDYVTVVKLQDVAEGNVNLATLDANDGGGPNSSFQQLFCISTDPHGMIALADYDIAVNDIVGMSIAVKSTTPTDNKNCRIRFWDDNLQQFCSPIEGTVPTGGLSQNTNDTTQFVRIYQHSIVPTGATHIDGIGANGAATPPGDWECKNPMLFKGLGTPPWQPVTEPGLVGYLTNEAHTFAANNDGSGADVTTYAGSFKVYEGLVELSTGSFNKLSFSVVSTNPNQGVTCSINSSTGVITLSGTWADASDEITFTLRASYARPNYNSDRTVDRVLTLTKSIKGDVGSIGAGLDLAVTPNKSDISPDTPSNGHIYVSGLDVNGNVADEDGSLYWEGIKYTVSAEAIDTQSAGQRGFLCLETGAGTPFTGASTSGKKAFIVLGSDGNWDYDNGTTLTDFSTTSTMLIFARCETNSAGNLIDDVSLMMPTALTGTFIDGNLIVDGTIVTDKLDAAHVRANLITTGNFETRAEGTGTTPRLNITNSESPLVITDLDGVTPVFSTTYVDGAIKLISTGEFVGKLGTGTQDTADYLTTAGLTDLRERLGLTGGGGNPEQRGGQVEITSPVDLTVDFGVDATDEVAATTPAAYITTGGGDITFSTRLYDYDTYVGQSSNQNWADPSWTIKFQYKDGVGGSWTDVPSSSQTYTGSSSNWQEDTIPATYYGFISIDVTHNFTWSTTGLTDGNDIYVRAVFTTNNAWNSDDIATPPGITTATPKCMAFSASEPLTNAGVVEAHTHTVSEVTDFDPADYLPLAGGALTGLVTTTNAIRVGATLLVGTTGTPRISGGDTVEWYGSQSSFYIGVQDGNGRVQMKWNASRGTSEVYTSDGEDAVKWEMDRTGELIGIYAASGTGKVTNDPITWTTYLRLVASTGLDLFTSLQVSGTITEGGTALASKYQALDADLTAIAALAGTTGLLKKTAADTWTLDTTAYLTANQTITLSGDISGSGATSISTTLQAAAITGKTELASGLVSTDELLVSDAGTLKRMDISVLQTYMQSNLAFNNYSHPNHSGDVTSVGDGAQTLAAAAITGKTALTSGLASTDELLVSDAGTLKKMDISVLEAYMDANLSYAGKSVALRQDNSGSTLSASDNNGVVYRTTGTGTLTIYLPSSATGLPAGFQCQIHNRDGGGDIDINSTTNSQTLEYLNPDSPSGTGNRTLAHGGVATLLYIGSGIWHIYGSGLT